MKLKNIYTGFTKDGKDRLLQYKEHYFWDYDTTRFVYQDLLTKEIFELYDIKENSLVPFKDVVNNNKKYMIKKRMIELYKKDRSINLETADLVVGDIYKKTVKQMNDILEFSDKEIEYDFKKIGHYIFQKDEGCYLNLLTGKTYVSSEIALFLLEDFVKTVEYIDNVEEAKVFREEKTMSKKKILEKYYNEKNI